MAVSLTAGIATAVVCKMAAVLAETVCAPLLRQQARKFRDHTKLALQDVYDRAFRVMLADADRAIQQERGEQTGEWEIKTIGEALDDFFRLDSVYSAVLDVAFEAGELDTGELTRLFDAIGKPDGYDQVIFDLKRGLGILQDTLILLLDEEASRDDSPLHEIWTVKTSRDIQNRVERLAQDNQAGFKLIVQLLTEREPQVAQPSKPPVDHPPRAEHFTGRETELAWLIDAFAPGRTVTLCAAGGMGKTALAAEALHALAPESAPPERFPDGVLYHTFYGRPGTGTAYQTILDAYSVQPEGDLCEAARAVLRGRTALIVLDGAEQADDLGAVRSAIPGTCGVLITTRLRKQAPDPAPERTLDLRPLQPEQALALLREFAGDWAQDETAANHLCKLVGYLPLALRLSGRYLFARGVTIAEYVEDLEKLGLTVLELDPQHASDSVPVLMRKSVEQVSDAARNALSAAGLLALAPIDGALIAAALGSEPSAARRPLGELVDYGLLVRDAEDGTYTTGHALVHGYARTELATVPWVATRLAIYLAVQFREHSTDFDLLEALRPHALALLDRCRDRALWEVVNDLATVVEDYLDLRGHWADRFAVIQAGLGAARARDDHQRESNWLNNLGAAYYSLGQVERAIEFYEQALVISREIGDRRGEGNRLGNLGLAYAALGQVERAIEFYAQALVISREIGDRRGEGNHLFNIGATYAGLDRIEEAVKYVAQALVIYEEIRSPHAEQARAFLARLRGERGDAP